MMSPRPTTAETGTPFPSPFPRTTKSGSMPYFSKANIRPDLGRFAVTQSGHDVAAADDGRNRNAVPQPLSQDDEIGFDAVLFEGEHPPRSRTLRRNAEWP